MFSKSPNFSKYIACCGAVVTGFLGFASSLFANKNKEKKVKLPETKQNDDHVLVESDEIGTRFLSHIFSS